MTDIEIPEGFTRWEGGEQPIPDTTRCHFVCRDGARFISIAGEVIWDHSSYGCTYDFDIIAYRVLP